MTEPTPSSAAFVELLVGHFGKSLVFDEYADFLHEMFLSYKVDGLVHYCSSSLSVIIYSAWACLLERAPESSFSSSDFSICSSMNHTWYRCRDSTGAVVFMSIDWDGTTCQVSSISPESVMGKDLYYRARLVPFSMEETSLGPALSVREWAGSLVEQFLYVTICEVLKYTRTTTSQMERLLQFLKIVAPLVEPLGLNRSAQWQLCLSDCLLLPTFEHCRQIHGDFFCQLMSCIDSLLGRCSTVEPDPSPASGSPLSPFPHISLVKKLFRKAEELDPDNVALFIRRFRVDALHHFPALAELSLEEIVEHFPAKIEGYRLHDTMKPQIDKWKSHVKRSRVIGLARTVPLLTSSEDAEQALISLVSAMQDLAARVIVVPGAQKSISPDTIIDPECGSDEAAFFSEFRHIFAPVFTRFPGFLQDILQRSENLALSALLHSAALVEFSRPSWAASDLNLTGSCIKAEVRQQFFVCLTCMEDNPAVEVGAVCETCADNCHRQFRHVLQSIGKRTHLSCHCGTSPYPVPCCIKAEENLSGSIHDVPIHTRGNLQVPPLFCFAADPAGSQVPCLFGGSDRPGVRIDLAAAVNVPASPALSQFQEGSASLSHQCIKCENFYHPACIALKACGTEHRKFWGAYSFALLAEIRAKNSSLPFVCPHCKADEVVV